MMTDLEHEVWWLIIQTWEAFLKLPVEHGDDTDEFRHGIHALQRHLLARPTRREINGPVGVQERANAAVRAERERSERLSQNSNFRAKAGEDAQATTGDASVDPVSRASENSRQESSFVEMPDGCMHGGREEPAAAVHHAPIEGSPRKAAEAATERSATQSLANGPCDAVAERPAMVGSATSSAEAGVSGQPETIPALTGQHASANVSGSERAGVTVVGDESGTVVPSFLMKPPKPLRPYCQRPGADDCGGYGSRHCHQCELAHEREEAA